MANERRITEITGLRQLFHEQWLHITQLFGDWDEPGPAMQCNSLQLEQAIETIASGTNAHIRGLASYKKQLRDSVGSVLGYIEAIAEKIPQVEISQRQFISSPLINALFVNRDEIKKVFSRSQELHNFFLERPAEEVHEAYLLLLAHKQEKTSFGRGMNGDTLVSDIQQKSISFTGHTLLSPCLDEATARCQLKKKMLTHIVEHIHTTMTRKKYEQISNMEPGNPMARINSLKNPAVYLQELTGMLNAPEKLLQLEQKPLTLNKMGIVVTGQANEAVNKLDLHELSVGSQPKRIIVIARYPRNELLPLQSGINA